MTLLGMLQLLLQLSLLGAGHLLLAVGSSAPAFRNPLLAGADPFCTRSHGRYYCLATRGGDIAIYAVTDLNELDSVEPVRVFCPSRLHALQDIWAPELHQIDGRWHILSSARKMSDPVGPFLLFALAAINSTAGPLGPYNWAGWLDPAISAIDPSYFEWQGRPSFLWSQFDPLPNSVDGWQQCVYLGAADTSIPARPRIESARLRVSCAEHAWEMVGHAINEGPAALQHDGRLFIVYSASLAELPEYSLGLLEHQGGDLLRAGSWVKRSAPVFSREDSGGVYGPGHCGFTEAADGTPLLLYHVKTSTAITFGDRVVHAKPFGWVFDGSPVFGAPPPPSYTGPLHHRGGSACPAPAPQERLGMQRTALAICATSVVVVAGLALSTAGSLSAPT